jgi:hypothetical protein
MRLLHEANARTRMQLVIAGWHHSIPNLPMLSYIHGSIKGTKAPGLEKTVSLGSSQHCRLPSAIRHVPLSDNATKTAVTEYQYQ